MKVKNIMFFGFAAAILSAGAANAAPTTNYGNDIVPGTNDRKIVTSKAYVDANTNKLAQDIRAIEIPTTTSDLTNDSGFITAEDVAESQAQADWSQTNAEAADFIKNKPALGSAAALDSANTVAENGTGLPTAGAVYTAIQDAQTAATGAINDETLTVTQNGVTAGTFTANADTPTTIAIVAPNWNAASGTAGYIDNKPALGSAAALDSANTVAENGTGLPTAGAVYTAIQTAQTAATGAINDATLTVTQNGVSAGTFTANDADNTTIAIAAPDWNAASGTAGYIDNKPTLGSAAALDSASTVAENGTGLPTAGAVYTAIQTAQTAATGAIHDGTLTITGTKAGTISSAYTANSENGATININDVPEKPTSCTNTNPCALVTDDTGNWIWLAMAQPGA